MKRDCCRLVVAVAVACGRAASSPSKSTTPATGAVTTVVAPDGVTADGLATALTVLDDERGARLLHSFPQAAARLRRHSL